MNYSFNFMECSVHFFRDSIQKETRDFFQSRVKFENYQVLWNTVIVYFRSSLLTTYNALGSALGFTLF